MKSSRSPAVAIVIAGGSLAPPAGAHCDMAEGPVFAAAKLALAWGDVTPEEGL